MGQTNAANLANQAGTYGQAMAQNAAAMGNIRASGYVGQANALTGALGQGLNYYQNQQMMDRYFPQRDAELMDIGNSTSDYGSYRRR
jgi:hypothetical protein